MKKALKKIVIILLCCILAFPSLILSTGCSLLYGITEYYGDYPELYTMACHSLITDGYIPCGEYECQVAVVPIETDNYGRIMFCYYDVYNYSLLICQFSDEENAYYYQDYNFINKKTDKEGNGIHLARSTKKENKKQPSTIDNPLFGFKEEDIANLKAWNDWDKPIFKEKCVSTSVNNDFNAYYNDKNFKSSGKLICDEIIPFNGNSYSRIIARDKFGNCLIDTSGTDRHIYEGDPADNGRRFIYITSKSFAHLEKDFSVKIYDRNAAFDILTEPNYAYQEALKKLRADNYWNICDLDEVIAQQTSAS